MSEKAPLIAPPLAHQRVARCHHVQRCSKGRVFAKLLTITAAAGLVYYGAPQG